MREFSFTVSFAYLVLLRWLYFVLLSWPIGFSLAGFGFYRYTYCLAFFLRLFSDIIKISF